MNRIKFELYHRIINEKEIFPINVTLFLFNPLALYHQDEIVKPFMLFDLLLYGP